jgi:hypothetical protein
MIKDSTDEFYTTSSGEGSSGLLEAQHGGTACSHCNYTMGGGHSDHLDHDDGSTVDPRTMAEQ